MSSWGEIVLQVEARAASRCEYCRMHQALQGGTLHVEHITPSVRGGASSMENLAWSCPGCNLHKSDRIDAHHPQSGTVACCKVAVHACFLSSRIYCAGSGSGLLTTARTSYRQRLFVEHDLGECQATVIL